MTPTPNVPIWQRPEIQGIVALFGGKILNVINLNERHNTQSTTDNELNYGHPF